MAELSFDLIVIGGGPGGYVAAIRAAQLGMKVAVVEKEHLGGVCLNWGCIPTKALLHTAEVYREVQNADQLGLSVEGVSVDFPKVIERSRLVADQLSQGVQYLMRKNKVSVVRGTGSLLPDRSVQVTDNEGKCQLLRCKHVVIATGARPRQLTGHAADGIRVWNYRHALSAPLCPSSMLIVGAGAIGMEFASFYSTMGSRVTVVETQENILPTEDAEISAMVRQAFERQGVAFETGTRLTEIKKSASGVTVNFAKDDTLKQASFDVMLVSIGVEGNSDGLGLQEAGVQTQAGFIVTDEHGATSLSHVYAIGDVAGGPCLAHKASHEAVACVEYIAQKGESASMDRDWIPTCTYCHPQVASVGLTEARARDSGYRVKVGRFPFSANGKALAMGDADGLVKLLFDEATGQLLGAHLVGPNVTELIHGLSLAHTLETTELELLQTIFPHPTLSESIHESVLQAYDRPLHV
ncbi:dihydrolipoyl dehydrogenase [Pollutimonas nitritireducens]|uniref:Dihydrolipoyl dehydrogenase n=1 Tax=Pollutimonas nitritireducens TaxID=2045209 RepID=A0A2N4UB74_9BURK|nr:dihydrolipoyl dehydrogenase [Pollutimonas nitritireducens]PLC52274.1 dihydrolipoyl dehydrogenase [Pollutimonas nitritireducens]